MHPVSTWGGIMPASLTMFDADGALDLEASAAHIAGLVDRGANGVVVAGTSGEFIAMSQAEKLDLFRAAVDAVSGRVPVIAGTGSFSTRETIELTARASEVGVDGAIVILPYYQRPHRAEVLEHFAALGREAEIPVMLYNNPTNTGTEPLDARDIGELARAGAVHAVKSTFPTVHQVHEAREEVPADFRVFYGSFMAPLEGMAGGAHGWISGILNVALEDALELWSAMQVGDRDAAHEAWRRILPYKYLYTRSPLGSISDLSLYRSILRLRGEHGGHCRKPLLPLTDEQVGRLGELLAG